MAPYTDEMVLKDKPMRDYRGEYEIAMRQIAEHERILKEKEAELASYIEDVNYYRQALRKLFGI